MEGPLKTNISQKFCPPQSDKLTIKSNKIAKKMIGEIGQ